MVDWRQKISKLFYQHSDIYTVTSTARFGIPHYTPKNKLLFIMTCLEAFGRYQNSSFKEPTSEDLSEKGLIPLFSCIICINKNYIPPHIHIPHIIFTSLIISCSSASEGFCPKDLITVASSWGANIYIYPISCWFVIWTR